MVPLVCDGQSELTTGAPGAPAARRESDGPGDPQGEGHQNYVAVARVLDASNDPAVQAHIDSASAFIVDEPQGVAVTVSGYELTRD